MRQSVTVEQRAEIKRFSMEGLRAPEIGRRLGIPWPRVAGIVAWLKHPDSWGRVEEGAGGTLEVEDPDAADNEVADSFETTIGLERDLQKTLRRHIEQLEAGLKIVDGDKEQRVASGYIDITAEDKEGTKVIIELKAGEADRDAVAQVLGYMGDVAGTAGKPVRGIIVASSFSVRARSAARACSNVELKSYSVKFTFEAADTAKGHHAA